MCLCLSLLVNSRSRPYDDLIFTAELPEKFHKFLCSICDAQGETISVKLGVRGWGVGRMSPLTESGARQISVFFYLKRCILVHLSSIYVRICL